MNLLILNDTSTSPNQGCQATMHMFHRGVRRFFPGASLRQVFLTTINHPFTPAEQRQYLPMHVDGVDAALEEMLRTDHPVIAELRDAIGWADLILINGEGSVLETQSNARMIYMAIELAHHYDVECHLINGTAHLTRPESIQLASRAFGRCASVCVREPLSYFHVKRFHKPVKLFPDIVVGLDVATSEPMPAGPYVMIGGGSATLRLAAAPAQMAELKSRLTQVCRALCEAGLAVQMMGWHRDEWLSEIACPGACYQPIDYVRYFAFCRGAKANFTGRHHGCVMSFAAGCPFLTTTANCYKNFGNRLLYGSSGPVLELERLDAEQATALVVDCAARSDELREQIESRRRAYEPFLFGAFENILRPTDDLVEAGVLRLRNQPERLAFVQASVP